eukprot:TRINITY_DN11988_c0_g3_i1.p1 TRINITY_DN11988_c0_g3~~TRINITY_DN11988_c0_g3_i1.p1  ORF type:complete len:577 (+),score=248.23 TRINITY_DN11988_c0_g3_i1:59-1732(+)
MSAQPSQAELDFQSEQYLRDKKIHHILNGVVCELVHKKPDDVLGFIASIIPKMKKEMQAAEEEKNAIAATKYPKSLDERPLTVVVLGASGDLAAKKTFPAMFKLFTQGLLPPSVNVIGYARSDLTNEALYAKIRPGLAGGNADDPRVAAFLARVNYVKGQYTDVASFAVLDGYIKKNIEMAGPGNRLFYLALPPSTFFSASKGISTAAMAVAPAWTRVIIEKPFGRDTESSAQLTRDLSTVLDEKHIYRIDHYLGKEMVQNLITLRFSNKMFAHVWDKSCIDNVQISFKETIGTMGRGGYFDSSGIIRDVLQNHLLQVMALLAMEKPKSLDPEAVRDEKVAVLSHVRPAAVEDCVLGQYTRSLDGKHPGYLEDDTVPAGSNCPTFAQTVLWVDDDRWYGVPFILKAAKAVEKKEVVIRIQFKPEIRPFGHTVNRNELVVRLQPDEAMYVKINAKDPGMTNGIHTTELDLTYGSRYGVQLPDAYESLIYEAAVGNPTNFVRSDELDAAWKVYTPLLHKIDAGEIKPEPYPFGTRGPPIADDRKQTFYTRGTYEWSGTR